MVAFTVRFIVRFTRNSRPKRNTSYHVHSSFSKGNSPRHISVLSKGFDSDWYLFINPLILTLKIGVNTLSLSHIECAAILDKLYEGFENESLSSQGALIELPLSKAVEGFEATEKGQRVVLLPE